MVRNVPCHLCNRKVTYDENLIENWQNTVMFRVELRRSVLQQSVFCYSVLVCTRKINVLMWCVLFYM